MTEKPREFTAFFSYAHHDARTDPDLISAMTTELEHRVNSKLVNARLKIWRDTEQLRTGDHWSSVIEQEIEECALLIVLLTPRWIDSDWCRRELATFERVEALRGSEAVAPLLARDVSRQQHHLTSEQRSTLKALQRRQYSTILATDFARLPAGERTVVIDKVADDLEGMLERIRMAPEADGRADVPRMRTRSPREFRGIPHNYADVDFVGLAEVVLRPTSGPRKDIYAQIDFLERLYVQGDQGRIEFGVRRAYLTVETDGSGDIFRNRGIAKSTNGYAYFVNLQNSKDNSFTICIDPQDHKNTLSELSLPVYDGENRYAYIGTAERSLTSDNIYAEISVSLTATDLLLSGEKVGAMKPSTRAKIEAIMTIAASKDHSAIDNGKIKRTVGVVEEQ